MSISYLKDLLAKQLGECVNNRMRNATNIKEIKTNNKKIKKSFLPSIKLWNMLSSSVQMMTDLLEFRNAVGLIYRHAQLYKPYMYGTSKNYVQISTMCMG